MMLRGIIGILFIGMLCGCATKQYESSTVEEFKPKADGFDLVVDKSILRMFNTKKDPEFNALIKDLDNVKVLTSDGGEKGAKALYKKLEKGIDSEGFEEMISIDNKDLKYKLYEYVSEDVESKWVLVFLTEGEAGLVEVNGSIDPKYLNALSTMDLDMDAVKDFIESNTELDSVQDEKRKQDEKSEEDS